MNNTGDRPHDALRARFAAGRDSLARPAVRSGDTAQDGPAPLSPVQRRLWFLAQLEPDSPAYNVPVVLRLSGQVDEEALLGALRDLAERHRVLRGVIDTDGPEPVVRSRPAGDVPVYAEDLGERDLDHVLAEETGRPFRLTAEPPMRAVVFRSSDSWTLALTLHHIATDGWSHRILMADLASLYTARRGGGEPLPPAPQYADVVTDETEDHAGLDWWAGHLAGLPESLDLPTDRPRTLDSGRPGATAPVTVPLAVATRVRAVATETGASPFMVITAAWQALLGRLADTDDVAVGVPHAGRHTEATEAVVGCFLDTVVVRTDLSGEPSGRDLIARVRTGALDAFGQSRVPFDRVVERLRPERTLSTTPVFQVLLNLYDEVEAPTLPGIRAVWRHVPPRTAKFDLSMELADGGPGSGLTGRLEYRRDLFDPGTAANLVRWFLALLDGMVTDPDRPVAGIPLEPSSGPALMGPAAEAATVPVHTQIERWADERPDATAVTGTDGTLSYRELDERANRLAHRLIALGVGPDQPVGILLDPGAGFATAVLGILKAGGAYLPMDTADPAARIGDMLRSAGARLVVTAGDAADRVDGAAGIVEPVTAQDNGSRVRPDVRVRPGHLAHVIFTSGSTGAPKGVAVRHGNLAHRVAGLTARMPQVAGASFAVVSTVAADLGLACLYGAWLTGGTLHMPDRETATDPQALAAYLARHQVDVVKLVPSHLSMLARHGDLAAVLPGRLLILGGEGCPWSLVEEVRRLRPGLAVHTHYGPTEATMMSLICDVDEVPADMRTGLVPLGRPLPGVTGLVVDRSGRPRPAGLPGELLLGGPGVTRGYVGRPDLTAERFPARPEGGRWYRTGDLVRLRAGGVVEFLGRTDDQVKVRGHRVELGEVTAGLRALPDVADAVVLPDGDGDQRRLACWVVPAPGHRPQPGAIRSRLRGTLAGHMVPDGITVVSRIPLTPNGKPDRAALRETPRPAEPADTPAAPSTPAEQAVAQVWTALLGLPRVGPDDDFFVLGGHSFAATRMVGMLAEATGRRLPVRTVFERPVLRDLAAELERRTALEAGPGSGTRRAAPGAPVRLSPAQERLWFLWRLRPDSDAYNTGVALRLNGPLDVTALRSAVRGLGARHDVLRSVVAETESGPMAVPVAPDTLSMPVVETGADGTDAAVRAAASRPFALDREPPLRALLLRSSETEHVLVLTVHHIAVDAWSWTTVLDDLAALYRAHLGKGPAPRPLTLQYADVAESQRAEHEGETSGAPSVEWWKARLSGMPPLALPVDRPHGPTTGWTAAVEPVVLPAGLAARLREGAARLGCTPFMVLLTAWQALLARLAGTEDVAVGVPVSGRTWAGTERMVGCFANTLVMRGDLSGDPTFRDALQRTRTEVLEAFDHAETPFESVVRELRPERDPDSTPLFRTMLNVIGMPAATDRFADLVATRVDMPRETAQVDLALALADDGTGFTGTLTYRTGLFDPATVRRWARWYIALLDTALGEPDRPVLAIDPLSAGERAELRSAATGEGLPPDRPSTVVAAVVGQASRRPDAVAVQAADGATTYAELAEESGRIAAVLAGLGLLPGEPVGVCLPRGRRLPTVLLAVLRARAAYLPLDPEHPSGRLSLLTEDAGVRVVLSGGTALAAARAVPGVTVIDVDEAVSRAGAAGLPEPDPQQVAYVLFTSGSTGRPKGVQVTHANLAAFVAALSASPGMAEDDVTLGVVPFTFDVFGYELWVTLAGGARIALADRSTTMDGHALAEWVERCGVTVATATPTALRLLHSADWPDRPAMRVISIGELLDPVLAHGLSRRVGALWNAYGPTETTVYSTIGQVDTTATGRTVPIGGPIAGTSVHVVDRWGRAALPGSVGELWIEGAGVALGYLHRPGLTAERFVTGPGGGRCYRTGDLVRWCGGHLEHLGRSDLQVKVRGHRVELGEIESVLREHPDVADAAVAVAGPAGENLAGYVVLRTPRTSPAAPGNPYAPFESHLAERLPDYMVPRRWAVLEEIPTTQNGKTDRTALPAPAEAGRTATPPESMTEQLVARVWSDVLGSGGTGREDHFFELGGDSFSATRVMGRLREALGLRFPVRALFDRPVLADFAGHVERTMLERLAAEPDGEQS